MKIGRWLTTIAGVLVLGALHPVPPLKTAAAAAAPKIFLVGDAAPAAAVRHGLAKLRAALEKRGVTIQEVDALDAARGDTVIVAGLGRGAGPAASLLEARGIAAPREAEALLIRRLRRDGQSVLLVSGADDRGLMYALLDVAERIGWAEAAADPLAEVRDAVEKPAVRERALSIYTMQQAHFESRFFNEEYWARYLDMLAANRFNTFALLFAYEAAGYFAPAYPYFFEVAEFPEVRVVGLTDQEQQRNLRALNRLSEMVHERGLNFTVGLWDHIYRGGVQSGGLEGSDPGKLRAGIVTGLTEQNLKAYSRAALTKFLKLVHGVDAVQFRMHGESGLKKEEMRDFWQDIYRVMKEHGPHIRFDARAKDFPDSLIDLALDMGVNIRISTKYWAEQMGLPFHPTHINRQNQFDRRHGYADLLRYPRRYSMLWQLWSGGTTRILLWGSPEYARRFAASTHLHDGDGFEVTEPLATKMASHPHDMKPFDLLGAPYRYYQWEFERYWHFFQVFGRLGYNPDAPPQIWRKEFEKRFGQPAAPYVEKGLHRASWILPRIIASIFPYNRFPTTRGWVEKQRWEDLPAYASSEGSDTQQFLGVDEAARLRIEGGQSARLSPETNSEWFADAAKETQELVAEAERRAGPNRSKEFVSTMVDLRILANLARYHSRRIHAALHYALFKHAKDLHELDEAIAREAKAIEAWEKLVEAAGDVYAENLMMGLPRSGLAGHWKDELVDLKKGLETLRQHGERFEPPAGGSLSLAHVPVRRLRPGEPLVVRVTAAGSISRLRVAYARGSTDFRFVDLQPAGRFRYSGVVPRDATVSGVRYYIQAVDASGRPVTYPADGRAQPIAVDITADGEAPRVTHAPVTRAPVGKSLTITAEVDDPGGVRWVRVLYRGVNQHFDYRVLEMRPAAGTNRYQAVIPVDQIDPKWDFMYLIETMDRHGNGRLHPDLAKETPYVLVHLQR